jgi:hypothetical protein
MLYTASYSFNTEVIDIAALAPTGKSMKEVKSFTGKAYGSMSLKRAWIYQIIKEFKVGKITADERNSNMKKTSSERTTSPLSPPPMKRAAAKLSQDLLQSFVKARTQLAEFFLKTYAC